MRTPTIHINGSSRETLMKDHLDALHALRKAQAALAAIGPNGRDYYPQGADAILEAQLEHQARWAAIQKVIQEIEQIAEAISGDFA